MTIIKMVSGIDTKIFKICIFIFLILSPNSSFSNTDLFPANCINQDKTDYNRIVNEFEKNLELFKQNKLYTVILYDLNLIKYCYDKINNQIKYIEIYENIIDEEIISVNTYKDIKYDSMFRKEDWRSLFFNYLLTKSSINRKKQDNKLGKYFPKSEKEFFYVTKFIEILDFEKQKNFKDIIELSYYSYLEDDIEFREKVLNLLNENLLFAKKINDLESYIILSRQKIRLLKQNSDISQCIDFYKNEIKDQINIDKIRNIRNFYTDLKILDLNKEISKIYENVFYCIPFSVDYSIKYTDLLEYLISKKNTPNTDKILKDQHIQVTFWQLESLNKLGREDEFINFKKKYENLLVKYDVSENEKIKYEIYKIKNLGEYNDISKKEKKVTSLLNQLKKLNYENYIKRNPFLDEQTFKAELQRLRLEVYRIYSEVLLSTGRKIQAVNIIKNQIVFYESFRNSNEYSAIISNDKLSQYKDTNQTLPDLYHQIILLFTDLKDQENYKKYSLESLKLCKILEKNNLNDQCYRINMSILRGLNTFEANLFSKDQIVEIIDSVDLHYYEFENNVNYKNYSKKTQARFKNDYLNATHFALIAIDGLSSREIIKFKYRPHNHTYYYLCESDWETEYLYNASLNKDIYKNAEFGALAIQTACLMNTGQDNFKETVEVEKKYLTFISNYLDEYDERNSKIKFKYLDTSGNTDKFIFHISGFYEYVKRFNSMSDEEKYNLKNRLFKSLQYQQARIETNVNKNFQNKYFNKELQDKLLIRKKIKVKYNNLIENMLTHDDVSEAIKLKVKYENNIDEIDNYIDKNFKDFAQLNAIKTYNFEEIQKYLKKDEALIYLINEEIQQAFIIKKKEAYLYSEPYLTTARTDGVLKLSKENITSDQNSKFNENVNALVFNTFFKSITSELKDIKKITILADKYYSSYPFEMMITNNPKMDIENLADIKNINKPRYLIQDYQVNYVPNIETFINLKNLTKSKINNKSLFLGVGDPKLTKLNQSKKAPDNEIKFLRGGNIDDVNKIYQNYDEIPFTGKEIKEISKVFSKSKTFLREKANEKQIKKLDLSKFNVISFATHAEVYGNFTEFNEPFLVLTPPHKSTKEDDGLLTTSEISQLDLKSDLVILSACNTSSKINKYAEGFSGLVSSFFQAGAKSIISTYWPVEDKAGYILMTKTMEKVIKKNFSVPQALQATKTEFINGIYGEEYKKPFYWAPYVYIGI